MDVQRLERLGELHRRAGALDPPVRWQHAIGDEDGHPALRRLGRCDRGVVCPGQRRQEREHERCAGALCRQPRIGRCVEAGGSCCPSVRQTGLRSMQQLRQSGTGRCIAALGELRAGQHPIDEGGRVPAMRLEIGHDAVDGRIVRRLQRPAQGVAHELHAQVAHELPSRAIAEQVVLQAREAGETGAIDGGLHLRDCSGALSAALHAGRPMGIEACSSAIPKGWMRAWQVMHALRIERWIFICWMMVSPCSSCSSWENCGTTGGGGGGGVPSTWDSTQLPRFTGLVRSGGEGRRAPEVLPGRARPRAFCQARP